MALAQLGVLVGYLLVVLIVGYLAWQRTEHNPEGFYVSDRGLGTLVLTFTVMASTLSTFAFLAVGGFASSTGAGIFVFLAMEIFAIAVAYQIIGERINRIGRRLDILTPKDHLQDRYGSPLIGVLYVVASFFLLIPYVTVQIVGGGIALDVLLNVDYTVGIVVITVIMAIYVHFSGMRGVAWTDLLQGIVMFTAMIGIFLFAIATIGSDAIASPILQENPNLFTVTGPANVWTPLYTVTFAIAFMGFVALPHIYQRMLSAGSPEILRSSSRLFPLIAIPFYFAATAMGVWATGLIPKPDNPDYYIPLVILDLAGPIVGAIVIAAAVAALMSTADSLSLSISSMIGRDIYAEYVEPDASQHRELRATQVTLVIVHILALALAFQQPEFIFELTAFAVTALGATLPAVYFGLFWKRATKHGAIASIIIGPLVLILFDLGVLPSGVLLGTHQGFGALVIAALVFVVVSLATEPPADKVLQRHF